MNAKTIERIILFRTDFGIDVAKKIIDRKIYYQFSLIRNRKRYLLYKDRLELVGDKKMIFVTEALSAREYWSSFEKLISHNCDWSGRKPQAQDIVNKFLDIGYHYLNQVVSKTFEEVDLPYQLGLLHTAQSKNSKPLVYDFMEWLRPIVVDRVLMIMIRKKKRKIEKMSSKDIAVFIGLIKKQLDKTYFHHKLGYCITLKFWMRMNALSLLYAINHHEYPKWIFPTLRHESRCKKTKDHRQIPVVSEMTD